MSVEAWGGAGGWGRALGGAAGRQGGEAGGLRRIKYFHLAKPTLGSKDRRIEGEGCAHLVRFLFLVRSVALL